ncbi:MAG TPA: hypothetical protein VFB79_22730 [Candidatus Angelobacter sp.]|nr:hypothetical protein [Candidatus Angelobacter sp.]
MKKLRRIPEAEIIAEFLKGEFFHKEYDADRDRFEAIVNHPDLTDERENEIRRALLFRRRDTMWWELPEDRQWWEVEFAPTDVEKVSVFPRAHWRKLAKGDFKALHVAQKVREQLEQEKYNDFAVKMAAIQNSIEHNGAPNGLIVFLGIDEHGPVTLLEGNHRFIASILTPGQVKLQGARMIGVFSPNMEQCCWYKTNFQTLFRCLKNRIQHMWDRDTDLNRLLDQASTSRSVIT